MDITKQDWKLFQNKIASWQESYMARLNREYIEILTGEGNPSEKFWSLEKRIDRDKRNRGVMIQMRKQSVAVDLAALITDGVITFADIENFSEELKERVLFLCGNKNEMEKKAPTTAGRMKWSPGILPRSFRNFRLLPAFIWQMKLICISCLNG